MARYDDPNENITGAVNPALEGTTSTDVSLVMTGFTLKPGTDVVRISHEGAPQVVNCQGITVLATVWVTNTYAISDADELICGTVTIAGGVTTTAAPLVIAEGVEDMDLRYGVDNDADGIANLYVHEHEILDWSQVTSAKVALLINSVDPVFANSIHGCESCNLFNPVGNRLLRAEYQATVRFRNR